MEILASASVLGCFDGLVAVWQASTLHQVRARRLVFATGVVEQPLVFAGNDLPGVMLAGGVRRLIALYGIAPGTRAVVATTSDRGLEAARALEAAGVEVVAVADLREGRTVLEAEGRKHVRAAVLGGLDGSDERRVECDLLVMSGGVAPATSLIAQAGGRTAYDGARGHFALAELPDGVHAAGAVAGAGDDPERSGAARRRAGGARAGPRRGAAAAPRRRRAERRAPEAVPPAVAGAGRGKCFACLCEDVTAKDIHLSVDEGYDSIELSKRYTTATMGPCQGRMCQLPAVRLMAQETGQDLAERRHHHGAPAVVGGPARRAGRPPDRARQALGHPSPPPRARRRASCGRATGAAPTTTATRRARRWPSTRRPGSSTSRRWASSSSAARRRARSSIASTPTASRTSSPGASATAC